MITSEGTESATLLYIGSLMQGRELLRTQTLGSHFLKTHAKVPDAKLERLCVFLLGLRVALKQLDKATNIQNFFVLPVDLNRDSLYFVLETKCIGASLSHSLQLHL